MSILDQNNNHLPDEKSIPFIQSAVKWGVILAGSGFGLFLLGAVSGISTSGGMLASLSIGLLAILLTIFILRKGMLDHRNNDLGGYMSFGRAFVYAAIVAVVSTIVGTLLQYLYVTLIDTTYLEKVAENAVAMMENMGAPEEVIDQQRDELAEKMTPTGILWQSITWGGGMSVVIALIAAAILKKDRPFV